MAAEPPTTEVQRPTACVFVLHGLARGSGSMKHLSKSLSEAGFVVHNLDYPSTRGSFPEMVLLLGRAVAKEAPSCAAIHFVVDSLGALVVRAYLDAPPRCSLAGS